MNTAIAAPPNQNQAQAGLSNQPLAELTQANPDLAAGHMEIIKGLQGIEWAILHGHSGGTACGY